MNSAIKTILLLAVFIISAEIQTAMGNELKLLSVNEFQEKTNADKYVQDDLQKYEINKDELITLYKMDKISNEKTNKRRLLASLK